MNGLETHNSDGERRLVDITQAELIALGMYYNRPAEELIFLTSKKHKTLHSKGKHPSEETKKKLSEVKKGKKMSEEARRKNSESHKGNSYHLGKHHSEEAKRKMSEAWDYDKHFTEEARKKLCKARKWKHWYNNGKINIIANECPDGFIPGMLNK